MKTASRHILCAIYALLSVLCMNGQTLNQYELLCRECIDLKERVGKGQTVSRTEASALIERFVEMNAVIKKTTGSMTDAERTRFEAVNRWFSTGIRPLVLDHHPIIAADPLHPTLLEVPYDKSVAGNAVSTVTYPETDTSGKLKTYLLATLSLPHPSYGAMIGLQYNHWGGYVRFNSNFKTSVPVYSCLSNGTILNGATEGGPFWPGSESQESGIKATAGILYGPFEWLSIYGGIGYGRDLLDWKDIDGNWVRVEDRSFKGLAAEAGILASWKHMTIGIGMSAISFRTASVDLSLGLSF